MNPLKNIVVNLQATGPAAVIAVWLICTTLLGIFGSGSLANSAMMVMLFAGGAVMGSLASKS